MIKFVRGLWCFFSTNMEEREEEINGKGREKGHSSGYKLNVTGEFNRRI